MILAVVVVGSAVALLAGTAYTLRWFITSSAREAGADKNGHQAAEAAHHHPIAPHDHATTGLLKHFFDGKACAICKRPIPQVHRAGLKPGLFDPATRETYSWDEIPNEGLSTALETLLPLCSACQVAESFRQQHPDLVVDRDRSGQHAPQPRIGAGS